MADIVKGGGGLRSAEMELTNAHTTYSQTHLSPKLTIKDYNYVPMWPMTQYRDNTIS